MALDVVGAVQALAWMLMGAALLGMLARWSRVPYAVALVLGGIALEETHLVQVPTLDPSLLLFVFLPPLLFDAAFRLDERELRAVLRPVLVLAVPGTVATALIVGLFLHVVLGMSLTTALLFGSVVSATDPVAVVPVFRHLGAPVRLTIIAEAESLINDGVAITLYTALVRVVSGGDLSVLDSLGTFVREVVGGVLIGGAFGVVFSRLTGVIDDHLIEMMLSTALAYGTYLVAQSVETSGALACVAAGLIHGSYGRRVGMSQNTRRLLDDLWEYFGFLANALVFLLVGFSASLGSLAQVGWPVLAGVAAVVASRAAILLLPPLVLPARVLATSAAERTVLVWGGLRGALTITLALALPATIPERPLLIALAFGVVLFSLVAQGLTLPLVVQRSGVVN